MRLITRIGMATAAGAICAIVGAAPAGAAPALDTPPYCPEHAPFGGIYTLSYVGTNGHHYDVYHSLPFSPFGNATIDCDA